MSLFDDTKTKLALETKTHFAMLKNARADIERFEEFCQVLRAHDLVFSVRVDFNIELGVDLSISMPMTADASQVADMLFTLEALDCRETRQFPSCVDPNTFFRRMSNSDVPDFLLIHPIVIAQPEPAHAASTF